MYTCVWVRASRRDRESVQSMGLCKLYNRTEQYGICNGSDKTLILQAYNHNVNTLSDIRSLFYEYYYYDCGCVSASSAARHERRRRREVSVEDIAGLGHGLSVGSFSRHRPAHDDDDDF